MKDSYLEIPFRVTTRMGQREWEGFMFECLYKLDTMLLLPELITLRNTIKFWKKC